MGTPVGDNPAINAVVTEANQDQAKAAQDKLAAERHDTPPQQQIAAFKSKSDNGNIKLVELTIANDSPGVVAADAQLKLETTDKIPPVEYARMTPDERLIFNLQQLILARALSGNLIVDKVTAEQLKQLVEQMQKEMKGDDSVNDGHPHFGAATKRMFDMYKVYLETRGVPATMQQLLHSDIGIPVKSPINLQMRKFNGEEMPEHPIDYYKRISAGGKQFTLTDADGAPTKTDAPPSQDTLNKLRGAEDFLNWGTGQLMDSRINLLEDRLASRITHEGFPKEWLDNPGRQTDRVGWCRSVQEHIDQCTQMGRAVDAALYLQNKEGMSDLVKEAIAHLPKHIHPDIQRDGDGKLVSVKEIKFDHPQDLDLANPQYIAQQQANTEWMQKYGKQILQALSAEKLAQLDPTHFLYWGDIEMANRAAVVNDKNEITDIYDKRTGPDRPPQSNEHIADINLTRCRYDTQEIRDNSGNLKEVVVDFNMQYGEVPPLGYQNLIMDNVGQPQHPSCQENPDGKLHFKPDDWVVVRDNHGQDVVMQAKDLSDYKASQEFNYYFDKTVTIAMDASMLVTGVGAIAEGVAVKGGANMAMRLIQGTEEGLKAAQLGRISAEALEKAGQKQILTGIRETFLGGSGLLNNAWGHENAGPVLAVRNAAFTYQAVRSIPGLSQTMSGLEGLVGFGKSASTVAAARSLLEGTDDAALSAGPILSFLKSGGETGLKWSGRAFGYTLARELNDQRKEIEHANDVDGVGEALRATDGLTPPNHQLTTEEKLEQQRHFLASTEKVLEDYVRTHDISKHQAEITKILDTTKHLLEPPSREIVDDPQKLAAFEITHEKEVDAFKADLRKNLVWSADRIHDAELNRANDSKYDIESNLPELQDRKTLVDETRYQQNAVDAANAALKAQQDGVDKANRDLNDEKNQTDAVKKAQLQKSCDEAQHELAIAQFQLDTAKARLHDAQDKAHLDLLNLQDADKPVNGSTAFDGKDDVKAASALAYMLLCVDEHGNLPKDGVLYSKTETVQGFHVTKEYADQGSESGSTHKVEVEQKDHDAQIQIRVSDLARYFTPDLQNDQSADKRMSTGETLDRLGIISLDTHASILKNILKDKSASVDEKSKALVDLGSVVSMLEISETQKRLNLTPSELVGEAGDHFTNTSADLKAVISAIASDDHQDKNVRGLAALYSYALGPHRAHMTEEDQAILQKAIGDGQSKPGLNYDQCVSFLKKQAGFDPNQPRLDGADVDHRDARVHALIALDKLLPPGSKTEGDLSHLEIAKQLAKCVTPGGNEVTLAALDALLQPAPGFDNHSRLSMLDNGDADGQKLAMQVRKAAVDGIELRVKPDKNARSSYDIVDAYAHAGLIQRLPQLLDGRDSGANAAQIDNLKQRAVDDISASLAFANMDQIAQRRADMLIAGAKAEAMNDPANNQASSSKIECANEAKQKAQDECKQAEAELSAVTGRSVKEIPADDKLLDLAKKIKEETLAHRPTKELEKQLREECAHKVRTDIIGDIINGKPNLTSLSLATSAYQDLAQASIESLAKLGIAGNSFATAVLREHAESDPRQMTYEKNDLLRYAAVKALQNKVLSPLDFSTWAADQIQNEKCPAIADILRGAARYAEVGMNPGSLAHQDDVARSGGDNEVKGYAADFRQQLITNENGLYHFLSGDALSKKLGDAKGKVYDGHPIDRLLDCGGFREQDTTSYAREKQALEDSLKDFWKNVDKSLIDNATSGATDPAAAAARQQALQACMAIVSTDDTTFKGWAAAKHKECTDNHKAWQYETGVDVNLDEQYAQLQRKAADALAAAARPGMPDAEFAAGLMEKALSPGLMKDSFLRQKLVDGLDKYSTHQQNQGNQQLHAAERDACDTVCNNLVDSIKNSKDYSANELQLRSMAYLNDHVTAKELPGVINRLENAFDKAMPPVQDAIRDFLASKRDGVAMIYNAAPDNSSKNPADRAEFLDHAMHDLTVLNSKHDKILQVDALVGQQDAMYLIFKSVKGLEHADPDDSRFSKLKELMKEQSDQFGRNYDNVRFAAAIGLFKLSQPDSSDRMEAYSTIAKIAAESPMVGLQRDATEFLKEQTATSFDQVERALREVVDKEQNRFDSNKSADNAYKLANSLHNLGTLLQNSDRKSDATEIFAQAFCDYCAIVPPKSVDQLSKMTRSELESAVEHALQDKSRDPRAFNDCLMSLAEVLAPGLKHEDARFQFAMLLTDYYKSSGSDRISADSATGSSELFRLARFYLHNGVEDRVDFCLNSVQNELAMNKPIRDRDQIEFYDLMAQAALKGGIWAIIGEDAALKNASTGASYAAQAYNIKLKQGYSIEELATSANTCSLLHEKFAQCEPENAKHLKDAENALTMMVDHLRKAGDTHTPALVHELKLLSDFYERHGDKQKAEQTKIEAKQTFEKVQISMLRSLNTDQLKDIAADCRFLYGSASDINISCSGAVNLELNRRMLRDTTDEQIISMIEPLKQRKTELTKSDPEGKSDASKEVTYLLGPSLYREFAKEVREHNYSKAAETLHTLMLEDRKTNPDRITGQMDGWLNQVIDGMPEFSTSDLSKFDDTKAAWTMLLELQNERLSRSAHAQVANQDQQHKDSTTTEASTLLQYADALADVYSKAGKADLARDLRIWVRAQVKAAIPDYVFDTGAVSVPAMAAPVTAGVR